MHIQRMAACMKVECAIVSIVKRGGLTQVEVEKLLEHPIVVIFASYVRRIVKAKTFTPLRMTWIHRLNLSI